jgi:hypothetical protein
MQYPINTTAKITLQCILRMLELYARRLHMLSCTDKKAVLRNWLRKNYL